VIITRNHLFDTEKTILRENLREFKRNPSSLGAQNNDDGQKLTIEDKHHFIGQ